MRQNYIWKNKLAIFYLLQANFFSPLKSRMKIGSDIFFFFFQNARAIKELRYLWGFGEKSEKIGENCQGLLTAEEDNLVCCGGNCQKMFVFISAKLALGYQGAQMPLIINIL